MPVLSLDELRKRLSGLFLDAGLGGEDTAALVDILISTEASGRRTHGLVRVRPMLNHLAKKGHRRGRWLKEDENSALYDGLDGLGYLVAYTCAAKAAELARECSSGLAIVAARRTPHTGPLGYFARMCALEGLISLCLANCQPLAVPYRAKSAVLGTNPITFGFPFSPEPVVVDLATTSTTYGDCKLALSEGRELPEGLILDRQGNPTTDPRAILEGGALLPFGGHKGYALAVAVQILTSAFIGAAATPPPGGDYGFTVIAMRRDIFVDVERYDQILQELVDKLKAAVPTDPEQPVILPGERSAANRRQAEQNGIHLSRALYEELFAEPSGPGCRQQGKLLS